MTDQEKEQFIRKGREALTSFAFAARILSEWTDSFTQRGGAPQFGNDAALIAAFANHLTKSGAIEEAHLALIARLRTDI